MKKLLLVALVLMGTATFAQVGIGTPAPSKSTMLDIVGTDKGVMIPRVTLTGTEDVATIKNYSATVGYAASLLVYNTATTVLGTSKDVTPGYYYWTGTITGVVGLGKWNKIAVEAVVTPSIITTAIDYTVLATDETILVNAASGDLTMTLPDATVSKGKKFNIKKIDATGNYVNVVSTAGLIEGVATIYGAVTLQAWSFESDGTDWHAISRF